MDGERTYMKFEIKKPNIQLPNIKMPKILKTPVQRSLTEEEVLKRLDIPDWRHMTKDKIMSFTSSLPYMDPEVAKEVLKKFPEFAKMCSDALTDITKAMNEVIDHTDKNTHMVLDAYLSEINTLQNELKHEDLSLEDKLMLNNEIKELLEKMNLVAKESNKQIHELFNKVLSVVVGTLMVGGAMLGVNFKRTK